MASNQPQPQPQPQPLPIPVAIPSGLTIAMTVFGAIGMTIWATSIGFLYGWWYYDSDPVAMFRLQIGMYITIPTNVALIYVASRLIFLVNDHSFPGGSSLQDLQQCVSRMVAFTILGFSEWVTSVVWLAIFYDNAHSSEVYITYHACNYGFVISAVVAGLAGGTLNIVSKRANASPPMQVVPPKYVVPQQSQAHYNQAYMQGYGYQQRV